MRSVEGSRSHLSFPRKREPREPPSLKLAQSGFPLRGNDARGYENRSLPVHLRQARLIRRPWPCLLESRRRAHEKGVLPASPDELNADRQAVRVKSARQADRRIAREVEGHGVRVPSGAKVRNGLAVDLDRPEEILIDRQRGPRQRRRRHDIASLEPRLDLTIEPRPGEDRGVKIGP